MAKPLTTMHNPFWFQNFADPFVLKVRGRYYAYGTEPEAHPLPESHVFPILTSVDLVSWSYVGKALPALSKDHFFYWAPEVTEYNGQFLLYYAVHTEEFSSCIRVAVAERPEGPFVDSGRDLTSHLVGWAIDPHVFRDQDGEWYLYITIEYTDADQGRIGSGNSVCRMLDPFTLGSELARVTAPSQDWQLFEAKRPEKGGQDWYTVEAPAVLHHGTRYYQLYSGGCYYRDNYAMSYATSDGPMGPNGLHDTSWQDWKGHDGNPLLVSGTKDLVSPGHNSLVVGPNNVDLYTCYHAQSKLGEGRLPCLDRLFWHGDTLWTPAPISNAQPAPALPHLRELFVEPQLDPRWQQQGGNWQVIEGAVHQQNENSAPATLQSRVPLSNNWLLEVNLCLLERQGTYGLSFLDQTGNQSAQIIITTTGQLIWRTHTNDTVTTTASLPTGTLLQAWHQLLIAYSGSLLTIQFDGMKIIQTSITQPLHAFALMTERCRAAFSGITLTDHFHDIFLPDNTTPTQLGWQAHETIEDPSWTIQEGMLTQTSTSNTTHMLLKGDITTHDEVGVTMRARTTPEQGEGALGLVFWQDDDTQYAIWLSLSQPDIRSLVAEHLCTQERLATHNLAPTFDLTLNHTLRIETQENTLKVYLDGPECCTIHLPSTTSRIGLITRNLAATFQDIWFTSHNPVR